MLAIFVAMVAMAARDCLATFLTIAEAKGRARLSGFLDALGDLAGIACTVVGAGAVITGGITVHTLTILGAMMVTSFFGTTLWTKLGHKLTGGDPTESRIKVLESELAAVKAQLAGIIVKTSPSE